MQPEIRKYIAHVEDLMIEGGRPAQPPLRGLLLYVCHAIWALVVQYKLALSLHVFIGMT